MTDALAHGDDKARTTLGRQRETRPAVLESEFRLPKHEGYLLFPDGLPVARIKLSADHIDRRGEPRQPGFAEGDPKNSLWQRSVEAPPPAPPKPGAPAASTPPAESPPTPPVGTGPV